jgi:Smg protein
MKENVLDVLSYLFDNYLDLDFGVIGDENTLVCELEQAGFPAQEIDKAFDWLGELIDLNVQNVDFLNLPQHSMRILTSDEQAKLDLECQGMLIALERSNCLDPISREIILERAMAIEVERLTLSHFKRVIALVMLNRCWSDDVVAWVEGLVYDPDSCILH